MKKILLSTIFAMMAISCSTNQKGEMTKMEKEKTPMTMMMEDEHKMGSMKPENDMKDMDKMNKSEDKGEMSK